MATSKKMKPEEILNIGFYCDSIDEDTTIRGYLITLLHQLWQEGEGFSGKRPFGNSGWEYDLYVPLITAGVVKGELDDDGYVANIDKPAAYRVISDCIEHLRKS